MGIKIEEKFEVDAPIDAVWRFMMDPAQVVTCMPGAQLDEVVDDKTFLGSIKVKVGAVSAGYKGRVEFTGIDEAAHSIELSAEGREKSGGVAKGTLTSRLRSTATGGTEIEASANVDLTGRIMQVGRGMIQGVSKQLFAQFVDRTKATLEAAEAAPGAAPAAATVPAEPEALRIMPVLFRALAQAIRRFFRRLLGRGADQP